MDTLKARFTLTYSLIVLVMTAALFAVGWNLLVIKSAGWSFQAGTLTFTHNTAVLALLSPLMLGIFGTQILELLRPQDLLILTSSGIHDRRLTQGEILWHQIDHIYLYRKGWQWMAMVEVAPTTLRPDNLRLGPMPLYALNRLCARWLKRPEINIGLGGMTVSTEALMERMATHAPGKVSRAG